MSISTACLIVIDRFGVWWVSIKGQFSPAWHIPVLLAQVLLLSAFVIYTVIRTAKLLLKLKNSECFKEATTTTTVILTGSAAMIATKRHIELTQLSQPTRLRCISRPCRLRSILSERHCQRWLWRKITSFLSIPRAEANLSRPGISWEDLEDTRNPLITCTIEEATAPWVPTTEAMSIIIESLAIFLTLWFYLILYNKNFFIFLFSESFCLMFWLLG